MSFGSAAFIYEETHRKLVEAFQEAACSDDFDEYPEVNIDLSFLNEDDS